MAKPFRVAIVAGEVSGDIIAARLIDALKVKMPHWQFEGVVGDKMLEAGCTSLASIEELSVLGFSEVVLRLPQILSLKRKLKKYWKQSPPDIYIGVDATAFNLPLERYIKTLGVPAVHYNSPKIWAWGKFRIHKIVRSVDLMLCLFPFEEEIYKGFPIKTKFVGHPLADSLPLKQTKLQAREQLGLDLQKPTVAILPGSRSNEVKRLAEDMVAAAKLCYQHDPSVQFVVPLVNEKRRAEFMPFLQDRTLPIKVVDASSHLAMTAADVVMLASGTATLEAMLVGRPMVVVYRLMFLTYWIGIRILLIKNFSLPNLLAGREVVPEFLQKAVTPEAVSDAVMAYFNQPEQCQAIEEEFSVISQSLRCRSSEVSADAIINLVEQRRGD